MYKPLPGGLPAAKSLHVSETSEVTPRASADSSRPAHALASSLQPTPVQYIKGRFPTSTEQQHSFKVKHTTSSDQRGVDHAASPVHLRCLLACLAWQVRSSLRPASSSQRATCRACQRDCCSLLTHQCLGQAGGLTSLRCSLASLLNACTPRQICTGEQHQMW